MVYFLRVEVGWHFIFLSAGTMPTKHSLNIFYKFRPLLQFSQLGSIFESSDLEQFRNEISQIFEIKEITHAGNPYAHKHFDKIRAIFPPCLSSGS